MNYTTLKELNTLRGITPDSIYRTAEALNKSFTTGTSADTVEAAFKQLDFLIEKSGNKYFKREGSPGNYKYYYTKEEYDARGKKGNPQLEAQQKRSKMTKDAREGVSNRTSEDIDGKEIGIGDKVMVSKTLTTDPKNKQGQDGEVVEVNSYGDITLKFEDGTTGKYSSGTTVMLNKKKSDKKEGVSNRTSEESIEKSLSILYGIDLEKAVPIGTVNKHGKVKTANGWEYQKKGQRADGGKTTPSTHEEQVAKKQAIRKELKQHLNKLYDTGVTGQQMRITRVDVMNTSIQLQGVDAKEIRLPNKEALSRLKSAIKVSGDGKKTSPETHEKQAAVKAVK